MLKMKKKCLMHFDSDARVFVLSNWQKIQLLQQIFFSNLICFTPFSIIVRINRLHDFAKKKSYFTGQFHAKLSRACHPYLMDFLEIFTRGRYHRDMKFLKILAFNSKEFRVYGIKNCKLMMIRGWGDRQTQKFHR